MDRLPYMPASSSTFALRVSEHYFKAVLYLPEGTDRGDAAPIASQFPKSHRVKASFLHGSGRRRWATVSIEVDLRPNRSKGDRNEAGEARIRNFVKKAHRLGYSFELRCARFYSANALTDGEQIELAEAWLGDAPFVAIHSEPATTA